jgi:hypothetical protein
MQIDTWGFHSQMQEVSKFPFSLVPQAPPTVLCMGGSECNICQHAHSKSLRVGMLVVGNA